ncbi:response regulator [Salidesulfovibrio brasiliensis]|uniref:response regulator n=1 Tax=Salidesulfovibrio brasiliensis TaxID=221711 RepID=UPI0006D0D3A2|nr:response regulator [Salidesulfovibrio brasiliensis]
MNGHTVLLVEDSRFFGQMVRQRIESELDLSVVWVETMAEALQALESGSDQFVAALTGLTLPDAPAGELISHLSEAAVPVIVFTATFDPETRESITAMNVADYVVKQHPDAMTTVLDTIRRFKANPQTRILVVDDSPTAVAAASKMLRTHRYDVLSAASAEEALEIMKREDDIRLVLTDYNMPGMDGFELTRQLRNDYDKDRLGIIGFSALGNNVLSARFIKHGANDFLNKPYLPEELYCRVVHALDMLERIQTIRDLSYRDHLTRLPNRRWFFESAEPFMDAARSRGAELTLAMIDIDHFKHVNDTYGHDVGDMVIQHIAELIAKAFRKARPSPRVLVAKNSLFLPTTLPATPWNRPSKGCARPLKAWTSTSAATPFP